MRKICSLILVCFLFSLCVSACSTKPDGSLIKSKRKFEKYIEPQQTKADGVIDLSEGPKLKYDAYFGPKSLNFDIKIVNPY